jgi:hypothetical protein
MAAESTSKVDGMESSQGSRELGPSGPGGGTPYRGTPNPIPETARWSMVYENPDLADYVRMLSFFEIEIGVVRLKSNEIIRVKRLGSGLRAMPSSRANENTSFYFHNTRPMSRRWDAKLARDTELDLEDSVLVHFYPLQTIEQLRQTEMDRVAADGKSVEDVSTTVFSIVPTESGLEFQVTEIEYR